MNPFHFINRSAEIARAAHADQTDKAGVDYFSGHLTSVASMGKNWKEQVLGYLHDVAEDTPISEDEVMELLQSEVKLDKNDAAELLEALRLLNNKNFPDRDTYLKAVKENPLAKAVKINDLNNNMELTRIANPAEKDHARVERYKREIAWMRD
ncbi:MAG: phosphohydrolase [Porphyromonadaceae bacterium]|nr:phosphohydrolase [Porphyromonadaceae bacterium]